jgi:hypothetical protein
MALQKPGPGIDSRRRLRRHPVIPANDMQGPALVEVEATAAEMESREPGSRSAGETLAAFILAVAAVATAWCAYQSARWNGVQATSFSQAGALRSESLRHSTAAGQQAIIDVTLAADWLTAVLLDETALATALRSRMQPELAQAMAAWLGAWQPGRPLPPGGPFSAGDYRPPGSDEAAQLEARAEAAARQARDANQHSDNYVLTGVVFALALFFGAIAPRFRVEGHARALMVASAASLVPGLVTPAVQPVDFGI